ncbi:MAG: permease [Acidobacteria bacterium]|nr:permease [Acidobacteriota bacterium]MBI3487201.1 permease [Acidobacteriota bacterium]
MNERNAVVGVFQSHLDAEKGIKELQRAGFNMKKLSIVGRDFHTEEHVVGYYNAGDRMKVWGKLGAFWGGLWGMLFGSALFVIPGLGPLVVFGPLVTWIVGALEGAAVGGGIGVLSAALFSLGIPKDSCLQYEIAVKSNRFLVITHGTGEEAQHAKELLAFSGAAQIGIYEEGCRELVSQT